MKTVPLKKIIYKWRVRFGLLTAIGAVFLAQVSFSCIVLGFLISLSGLFIRAWACGHIQKEKKLSMSGPYRYTRNPLYLGNLLIGVGVLVGSWSWWVLGIFCLYFLIFYPVIIEIEKQKMQQLFPEQYARFQKVPLFFPSIKPRLPKGKTHFQRDLYVRNREYRALIGVIIFWIVLSLKALVV
ncbi:MAG: hypothetical protein GF421_10060 [Candidatus Aminicenantes bacterium]|nr:hypothetical protein [Candidatus Aminicenantes bacterium]